jgi:hypothetical protein
VRSPKSDVRSPKSKVQGPKSGGCGELEGRCRCEQGRIWALATDEHGWTRIFWPGSILPFHTFRLVGNEFLQWLRGHQSHFRPAGCPLFAYCW